MYPPISPAESTHTVDTESGYIFKARFFVMQHQNMMPDT